MVASPDRSPVAKRQYLATLVLLASGGVLGLAAASRPWGSVRLPSALTVTSMTVSGSDLLPFAPAVSLVAIAAVIAVPAVRRIGRRIIGAILAVLGAALAVTAGLAVADLAEEIESWAMSDPGAGGIAEGVTTSAGWALAVTVAGAMIMVAGGLIVVLGPSWPAMGARYERTAARSPSGQATSSGPGRSGTGQSGTGSGAGPSGAGSGAGPSGAGSSGTSSPSARETWEALDRGEDPT